MRLRRYRSESLIEDEEYQTLLCGIYGETGSYLDEEAAANGRILLGLEKRRAEILAIINRTDKAVKTLEQRICANCI